MKKQLFKPALCALYSGLTLASVVSHAETKIPADVKQTCVVSKTDLSQWFAKGNISKSGFVDPANSLNPVFGDYYNNKRCDFYKWGAQMFLWLSSPVGSSYVFDGPSFFDVVQVGSDFQLVNNTLNKDNNSYSVRSLKQDDPIGSTGQAGGDGVLLSQQASLTYYGINVNDVFAYYRTGQDQGKFKGTEIAYEFPNTIQGLRRVENFAGRRFKDGHTLAMEIKTSWVDASTVDASRYLVIDAKVPSYDRKSTTKWALQKDAMVKRLALVGMHVVGTVTGHPEMVWATFEHLDNAPDQKFYYLNDKGKLVKQGFDASGDWTFAKINTRASTEIQEFQVVAKERSDKLKCGVNQRCKKGDIVATANVIQENNVIRQNPWGSAPISSSNNVLRSNTDLISLNHSILPLLKGVGDVRANYFQVGSIWTATGQIPENDETPADPKDNIFRGSLSLSNATMETFHQAPPPPKKSDGPVNCFGCHNVKKVQGKPREAFKVSHIFSNMQPLHIEK
ncbi:hypothetical protein [Pseudoalteromonas luteoviolacea]|uniref:hypothetical protein n=1 Tax=Pseudoalteromonas luteoviolacea TaxID=43657 RepID=UPI001B366A7D|nr:hypothetical protein [Pseudoalteromonas luteoviolacea]MBQ4834901.1 hypothetical protein [Pseudoalteromonas luteoviolacea]